MGEMLISLSLSLFSLLSFFPPYIGFHYWVYLFVLFFFCSEVMRVRSHEELYLFLLAFVSPRWVLSRAKSWNADKYFRKKKKKIYFLPPVGFETSPVNSGNLQCVIAFTLDMNEMMMTMMTMMKFTFLYDICFVKINRNLEAFTT